MEVKESREAGGCPPVSRRKALRLVSSGLALLAAPSVMCSKGSKIPDDVLARIPLSSLPTGQRVILPVHENPVEFLRTPVSVSARSLKCTHLGCEVSWVEAERSYKCPCHEGTFDEEGRVVAGPPPRPLRVFTVSIEGDAALVRA